MAQTGYTPISLYYSSTASAAPTAGNLVAGELAINTADGKLFYKDSSGVVQTLATKDTTAGTFTSITDSGNLTFTGTGNRIRGDFSNGTFANRVYVQTSTSGGNTSFGLLPDSANATPITTFEACLSSDPANTNTTQLQVTTTDSRINAGTRGTASALPLTMYTGGSERLRIDTSGNVGIGTSSPAAKLDVAGNLFLSGQSTADQIFRVGASRSGNGYSLIDLQGDTTYNNGLRLIRLNTGANAGSNIESRGTGALTLITQEAAPLVFSTSATERMRIDSSGNLLVGTTTSTLGMAVQPNAFASGSCNINVGHTNGTASGSSYFQFVYNGSVIGSITQSGTTGVLYNIVSDRRLKENIVDAPSALSLIDSVKVRSFDFKSDGSHTEFGLIAQEFYEVAPQCVNKGDDGEEIEKTWGLDASALVPALIKAVQELKAEIDLLKGK